MSQEVGQIQMTKTTVTLLQEEEAQRITLASLMRLASNRSKTALKIKSSGSLDMVETTWLSQGMENSCLNEFSEETFIVTKDIIPPPEPLLPKTIAPNEPLRTGAPTPFL